MPSAKDVIYTAAISAGIDPELFLAICTHESALDPTAIRFEAHYRWLYHPREFASRMGISDETEIALQRFSYGLPQVMGAVLREYGFQRPLQCALEHPEEICVIAAKHLKKLQQKYSDEAEVIAAYNAGSAVKLPSGMFENQRYVDAVSMLLRTLRTLE